MSYYNLQNIRYLLINGFTAEELRRLCYDILHFRPVYDQLAQNTGKAEIIDHLVEYAERKGYLDSLLAWAKEHNPFGYKKHAPYISKTTHLTEANPEENYVDEVQVSETIRNAKDMTDLILSDKQGTSSDDHGPLVREKPQLPLNGLTEETEYFDVTSIELLDVSEPSPITDKTEPEKEQSKEQTDYMTKMEVGVLVGAGGDKLSKLIESVKQGIKESQ